MPDLEASKMVTSEEELEHFIQLEYQELRRFADQNLDKRVQGRVSPSDVVQDAWVDAVNRIKKGQMHEIDSVKNWIRFLVKQSVNAVHRLHLGASKRDATRDVPQNTPSSDFSGEGQSHLNALSASGVGPSTQVAQAEMNIIVRDTINQMTADDREILLLRHEQGLTNQECAERLGLSISAASKRYNRALDELERLFQRSSVY